MARPPKEGIDYFSHDVRPGRRMQYLMAVHGGLAKALWNEILELIYGVKGYFTQWSDRDLVILVKSLRWEIDICRSIFEGYLQEGLFDRDLYEKFGILTSIEIQKRYLEACGKRSAVYAIEEYWRFFPPHDEYKSSNYYKVIFTPITTRKLRPTEVYGDSRADNPSFSTLKTTLSAQIQTLSTQSKVNESKVTNILSCARELENQFSESDFMSCVMPFFAATRPNKHYSPLDRDFLLEVWKKHGTAVVLEQIQYFALSGLKRLTLIAEALDPANTFKWEYRGEERHVSALGIKNRQESIRSNMTSPDYYTQETENF